MDNARASALYIGHSQSEQTANLANQNVDFRPAGQDVLLSLDINDNWTVSFDYEKSDDSAGLPRNHTAKTDSTVFGASLGYYWQNWSLSAGFSKWQDEQVLNNHSGQQVFLREVDTPSYSLNLTRSWLDGQWFYAAGAGLSYNNWTQDTNVPGAPNRPPQKVREDGNSAFVSLSVNANRRFDLEQQQAITLGVNLGWNQKLKSDSSITSHNGRPVPQRRQPSLNQRLNVGAVTGSDSYGYLGGFVSYDFNPAWFIELSASTDIGADDNQQRWAVQLGYLF